MKKNILLISLTCLFVLLLGATALVSFSGNIDVEEVVVKSITPVYDENSTIEITEENGVIFNDKNQVVDYKVVIENKENYDVKINNINLTTPTEEFLNFEVKETEGILESNSTKEIVVSFETMGIKGWGRNFNDKLTANISFEKVSKQEEPTPPAEDDEEETSKEEETPKEDEKNNEGSNKPEVQPEAPAKNKEELINKIDKIEVASITKDTIEFKDNFKVKENEKIAIWIYSEPIFLGYFDVVIENGVKKIEGLEETLKKANIKPGEHNVVLVSGEETLGYVNVYIDENKQLLTEKTEEENVVENPYTSDNKLVIVLISATAITGLAIIVVSKNKFAKYTVFILMLSPVLTTSAEESIELPIKFNISFESQNIMSKAYNNGIKEFMGVPLLYTEYLHYWAHKDQIKNVYIENELNEIAEYVYKYDVSEKQNGRVNAYLVANEEDNNYFDLYLQADGVIYPNTDVKYYFSMMDLISIANLKGLDTSKVTDMSYMFSNVGYNNPNFTLELRGLDTSNVTNMSHMFSFTGYNSTNLVVDFSGLDISKVTDMSHMFSNVGYNNPNFTLELRGLDTSKVTNMSYMFSNVGYNSTSFTLDVSNFDTSKVTNMSNMFSFTGYNSTNFTLDVSNFDTSNVTDMSSMFKWTGYNSTNFTLDVSNFDTSNVTDMSSMFYWTGYNSTNFTLDVSNFDTSNVTDMNSMFSNVGYNSTSFTLDVSNFDTSKVTNMSQMFSFTGYNSTNFTLDVSNFDTSNVTDMSYMFKSIGLANPNFTLDVSNFDTSNVTDMRGMFSNVGHSNPTFTLDVSNFDTSKVTNMDSMFWQTGYESEIFTLDISNFDTSNVTNMYSMFESTGYYSTDFTLNLGDNFDVSKVTNMHNMFECTGYNSTKLNVEITITNPELNYYSDIFLGVATKEGSQITVNYTSKTSSLVDKMIATKSSDSNVLKGKCIDCVNYDIGTEIDISGEKFNVISQTDDTITMLAQYNLSTDYRQSTTANGVKFSDTSGWEYTPGPKEIDIYTWSTIPKTYINNYVDYLKSESGDTNISGNLITLSELSNLGCIIPIGYISRVISGTTCKNSPYEDWLINDQHSWTRSASDDSGYSNKVWIMKDNGEFRDDYSSNVFNSPYGIRPVITISKEALEKLN